MIISNNNKFFELKTHCFTGRHGSEGGIGGDIGGRAPGSDGGGDGGFGGFKDLGDVHPDSNLGMGLREAGLMDHTGRTRSDAGFSGGALDVGAISVDQISGGFYGGFVDPESAYGQALEAAGFKANITRNRDNDVVSARWSAPPSPPAQSFDVDVPVGQLVTADILQGAPTATAEVTGAATPAGGGMIGAHPDSALGQGLRAQGLMDQAGGLTAAGRAAGLSIGTEGRVTQTLGPGIRSAAPAPSVADIQAVSAEFGTIHPDSPIGQTLQAKGYMTSSGSITNPEGVRAVMSGMESATAPAATLDMTTQETVPGQMLPDVAAQFEAQAQNPAAFGLTMKQIEDRVMETALAGVRNLTDTERAVLDRMTTATTRAFNDPRRLNGNFTMAELETMHDLSLQGFGAPNMATVTRVVDSQMEAFGKTWGPIRPSLDSFESMKVANEVMSMGYSPTAQGAVSVKQGLGTVAGLAFSGLTTGVSPMSAVSMMGKYVSPRGTQTALGIARAALDPSSLGQAAGIAGALGGITGSRQISALGGLLGGIKGLESPTDIGKLKAVQSISRSLKGLKAPSTQGQVSERTVAPSIRSKAIREAAPQGTAAVRQVGARDFGFFDNRGQLLGTKSLED